MAFRVVPLGVCWPPESGNSAVSGVRGRSRSSRNGDLLRPRRYFTKAERLVGGRFEALVHGLRVFRGDRYLLILFAQLFLNEGDGVIAGRKALNLILPI